MTKQVRKIEWQPIKDAPANTPLWLFSQAEEMTVEWIKRREAARKLLAIKSRKKIIGRNPRAYLAELVMDYDPDWEIDDA